MTQNIAPLPMAYAGNRRRGLESREFESYEWEYRDVQAQAKYNPLTATQPTSRRPTIGRETVVLRWELRAQEVAKRQDLR